LILLDTHALVFHALKPDRLGRRAAREIRQGEAERTLAISDITLWEIAMLIARGRVDPGIEAGTFLSDLVAGLALDVLPVTPAIAVLATSDRFVHGDPADRIIGATALVHQCLLVSSDERLRKVSGLSVAW
jgi:PIN domain nuclease of toxin-antitoxin system